MPIRCVSQLTNGTSAMFTSIGPVMIHWDEMTVIAVGGIGNAADARERLEAGATLLQAYTAFVYEGAAWPAKVQRELAGR